MVKKARPICPTCGHREGLCSSLEIACQWWGCPHLARAMKADPELRARLEPRVTKLRRGLPLDKVWINSDDERIHP